MEYQQIAAACFFFLPSTDGVFGFLSWNGAGAGVGGLVFGTLLGPEATGPGRDASWLTGCDVLCSWYLFVSGFLAAPIAHVVCVGCVVWGCCLRTT